MDFDKCTRNPICKTCSSERYCNGGIEEKKKEKKKRKKRSYGRK